LKDKYFQEIKNRGFEVGFSTGYKGEPWSKSKEVEIELVEKRRGLRLYVLDDWKKYSRYVVYHCRLVYLAGVERGDYWAIRCPSTVTTIDEALDYTTPADANKAKAAGRRVLRQGDVFAVEMARDPKSIGSLPDNHKWDKETRVLSHPTHKDLHISFPCKFVVGKSMRSNPD